MILDTMPPVISNGTYEELLTTNRLATKVYSARRNFQQLCQALEELYAHFEGQKSTSES